MAKKDEKPKQKTEEIPTAKTDVEMIPATTVEEMLSLAIKEAKEGLFSKEEVQDFLDQKTEQIRNDVAEELRGATQQVPPSYLDIDFITEFQTTLKLRGELLTHEREKAIRWFVDRLRQHVNNSR